MPSFGGAEYQAVFLANGQTYFGRFNERLGPYVRLDDAFYIQAVPNSDPDKPADSRIVRRGGELHQPLSRILIPRSAIVFVEDLRTDSPIAQFMRAGR